jgi:hypothetical protein
MQLQEFHVMHDMTWRCAMYCLIPPIIIHYILAAFYAIPSVAELYLNIQDTTTTTKTTTNTTGQDSTLSVYVSLHLPIESYHCYRIVCTVFWPNQPTRYSYIYLAL